MEACKIVEGELDKVDEKLLDMKAYLDRITDYLIPSLAQLRSMYQEVDEEYLARTGEAGAMFGGCMKDISLVLGTAQKNHREIHGTVSKVGRAIDRNFTKELGPQRTEGIFSGQAGLEGLTTAVANHLQYEGLTEVAEKLLEEAVFENEKPQLPKEPFNELHRILNALKNKDLEPAFNWVNENRVALDQKGSDLEFKLRRVAFLNMVKTGPDFNSEALKYAREYLSPFAVVDRHQKDIQTLMGCLVFRPGSFKTSPYSDLFDESMWDDIVETFRTASFAQYGIPLVSPLAVTVEAGCSAVPQLLTIAKALQPMSLTDFWNGKEELPIDISAGKEYYYHSVFVCPILKQPTSEENPPVRLVCGHTISQLALLTLASISSGRTTVKCPYCPTIQDPAAAKVITF